MEDNTQMFGHSFNYLVISTGLGNKVLGNCDHDRDGCWTSVIPMNISPSLEIATYSPQLFAMLFNAISKPVRYCFRIRITPFATTSGHRNMVQILPLLRLETFIHGTVNC